VGVDHVDAHPGRLAHRGHPEHAPSLARAAIGAGDGRRRFIELGSYTCPPFRSEMPAVGRVHEDYQDRADFYFIYIEEAHAHDVWPLASNARASVVYGTAKDAAERAGVAGLCTKALKIGVPTLVDDMANSTAEAVARIVPVAATSR
jgi:thyroxine 5-deiodinase